MRLTVTPRTLATAAALAGTGLLGAAVGGMASVDRELAAAVPPAADVRFARVVYVPASAGGARDDCLRPAHVRTQRDRPAL